MSENSSSTSKRNKRLDLLTKNLPKKYNRHLDAIFTTERKVSEIIMAKKKNSRNCGVEDDTSLLVDNWIVSVEDALTNPISRMYIARALGCVGIAELCKDEIQSDEEKRLLRHSSSQKVTEEKKDI